MIDRLDVVEVLDLGCVNCHLVALGLTYHKIFFWALRAGFLVFFPRVFNLPRDLLILERRLLLYRFSWLYELVGLFCLVIRELLFRPHQQIQFLWIFSQIVLHFLNVFFLCFLCFWWLFLLLTLTCCLSLEFSILLKVWFLLIFGLIWFNSINKLLTKTLIFFSKTLSKA